VKVADLNSLRSAQILSECKEDRPCFVVDHHRPSGWFSMETGNDFATVHVVFGVNPEYDWDSNMVGIESVNVLSVRLVFDDLDVTEFAFEPTPGTDLHREWCEAMLEFVEPHAERLLEMI